jgi:hypothetical protein
VIYPVDERRPDTAGLAPAFAAARARLGLVALLFILAVSAWWYTLDRTRGMDSDQGMRDDPQRTHPRALSGAAWEPAVSNRGIAWIASHQLYRRTLSQIRLERRLAGWESNPRDARALGGFQDDW